MRLVDYDTRVPEENLALDELLLEKAEKEEIGETLRFWMSDRYFVVAGRGSRIKEDCRTDNCRRDDVKILRRISGGGTVLQGPGCMNYSMVLSYERDSAYRSINASYRKILGMIAGSFTAKNISAEFSPVSDLSINGRKFSGNAQARKKKYFLIHGTVLLDFDIPAIARYLKHPGNEPAYRKGRPHGEFVDNIRLSYPEVIASIGDIFCPGLSWAPDTHDLEKLAEYRVNKYSSEKWNYSF